MRAPSIAIVLAACAPQVAPGTYLCGQERLCPEGQACNGTDNICVLDVQAKPFECTEKYPNPANDDAPANAQQLGSFECVSVLREAKGCLSLGDTADFYTVDVPASCSSVKLKSRVNFPLAFQPLALTVAAGSGTPMRIDSPCTGLVPPDDGEESLCLETVVTPGTRYAVGVVPAGGGDCDGGCAFNRYLVNVQLVTP
jgi:hypothetical protein